MRAVTCLIAPVLAAALAIPTLAAPLPAAPQTAAVAPLPQPFTGPEYVMGNVKARVKVTEYASVACPHCAKFDAQSFPAFKAKYVDTGKVRFALREMLVGDEGMVDVAAAGFVLARCTGQQHYFDVVEAMYRAQPQIFATGDLKGALTRIAGANGLDPRQMEACLDDKANFTALDERMKLAQADKIEGTPTFLVNGKKLDEHGRDPDLALLDAAIQPLLAHRR